MLDLTLRLIMEWLTLIQWGNVAEWVSGLGTVGALAAAVIVYARDAANRRRDDEERRRHQASHVSGAVIWDTSQLDEWLQSPTNGPEGVGELVPRPRPDANATASNDSDQPIYNVAGRVVDGWTKGEDSIFIADVLAGGERTSAYIPKIVGESQPRPLVLHLYFTDSNGIRWCREPDGRLVEQAV